MPAGGFKTFVAGEILTAADTNAFLMQGILVFDDATARDAAITAPVEGQFAFRTDDDVVEFYDGSDWVGLSTNPAAVVSGTTGSPTIVSGTAIDGKNYDLYTFNGAGSMIFSDEGYVDIAVIGGGGGSSFDAFSLAGGGGGGGIISASAYVSAGTVTIGVGGGGAGQGSDITRAGKGGVSSFGTDFQVNGGGGGVKFNMDSTSITQTFSGVAGAGGGEGGIMAFKSNRPTTRGSGAGSTVYGSNTFDGRQISITGSSVTYARAKNTAAGFANTGDGGGVDAVRAGGSGRVIVRVQV
jgi:mucin-19